MKDTGKQTLGLRGIITVLNTPFTDDDRVDEAALRRNVRSALGAGVSGFLVPAMAAEVGRLGPDERTGMAAAVRAEAEGRVPVIAGVYGADRAERLAAAEAYLRLGCEGLLLSVPYRESEHVPSSGEPFLRAVRDIADLQPGFLMLQDWDPSGPGLPIPLILRLFEEVPAFRSLKVETIPAGPKYTALLSATGGRLHVAGGWAVSQLIEALDRGVHAFMPTGMHDLYVRIVNLYTRGDRERAWELFRRLLPVLAFSNQHLDISIRFFKRLLWRQGVYPTPRVREPLLPFDPFHENTADELIRDVLALSVRLDRDFPL